MAFGAFAPLPLRLGGTETEGWTSPQHARVCGDMVAFARSVPFAVWRVSYPGGLTAVLLNYFGQNGSGTAYGPTCTVQDNAGEKTITMTWSNASPADPYGVSAPIALHAAVATGKGVNTVAVTANVSTDDATVELYLPESAVDDITVVAW